MVYLYYIGNPKNVKYFFSISLNGRKLCTKGLQNYLELNGLTASEVARKSGISTTTISDWKHGRSTPKHDKLAKIAKALGVSVNYLNGEITWEEEVSRQFEEKKRPTWSWP